MNTDATAAAAVKERNSKERCEQKRREKKLNKCVRAISAFHFVWTEFLM